jgi:hypothetical protein
VLEEVRLFRQFDGIATDCVSKAKDKRGVDLVSDALPFGRIWHTEPNPASNAIGYAKHRSRSHAATCTNYVDTRGDFLLRGVLLAGTQRLLLKSFART